MLSFFCPDVSSNSCLWISTQGDRDYGKQYYESVGIAARYLSIHGNFLRRTVDHLYASKKRSDYFDTIFRDTLIKGQANEKRTTIIWF
jgi:hypothetical protein